MVPRRCCTRRAQECHLSHPQQIDVMLYPVSRSLPHRTTRLSLQQGPSFIGRVLPPLHSFTLRAALFLCNHFQFLDLQQISPWMSGLPTGRLLQKAINFLPPVPSEGEASGGCFCVCATGDSGISLLSFSLLTVPDGRKGRKSCSAAATFAVNRRQTERTGGRTKLRTDRRRERERASNHVPRGFSLQRRKG